MSRIGKQPITIPAGVTVTISGKLVTVEGPKGKQELRLMDGITTEQAEGILTLGRKASVLSSEQSLWLDAHPG